ncbi:hypothetical protein FB379_11966 [Aeribacillus composti]|nr:hypothetical protein FB379_11966 [Aeribacillus composti]
MLVQVFVESSIIVSKTFYEDVYLKEFKLAIEARGIIGNYLNIFDHECPHLNAKLKQI